MIQEVLQSNDRLQNRPQIFDTRESQTADSPDCINIERQTPFSELKPCHFASGQTPYEPLVDLSKRNLRRPEAVDRGRPHRLRLEHEEQDLALLGAQPQRERVPRVVGQDREVGWEIGNRRRKGGFVVFGWREREELEELQGPGAADREGLDDELAAETDAFYVGASLEGEIR